MCLVEGKKGSFTVELACLMPLILLVLLGSIYLCFYVHNRAWLTAAAYESALVACQEREAQTGREAAFVRDRTLLSPGLFGVENLGMEVEGERESVTVRFDGDTIASYGGLAWHLQARAKVKRIDPVAFIWRLKGLEGLTEQVE